MAVVSVQVNIFGWLLRRKKRNGRVMTGFNGPLNKAGVERSGHVPAEAAGW